MTKITAKYGLPAKVSFCRKCVMSNQKPSSTVEFKYASGDKKKTIAFDAAGVCDACHFAEYKETQIDWKKREKQLRELCDRYRRTDSSYDCIVPGSGGKDSAFASHVLKYKYGMHPLTVTWAPHLYTDIGWKNFQNWLHVGGFDNYLFTPNGRIHRLLTRNAFLNLLYPFQPFVFGQKTFAPKMALKFNIPLVFYGESPGEYGSKVTIDKKKFSQKEGETPGYEINPIDKKMKPNEIFLGGKSVVSYLKEGISAGDLAAYLPIDYSLIEKKNIEFHFLGYYIKWIPQEAYYYAVKHTGFEANPVRTEGTYSKYKSLDDKTDGFFYYSQYIKFGYGRTTQDAAQEIRNHHITRDEGVALVKRFDGEFPQKYFKEFLAYIDVSEKQFWKTIDSFRDSHLWEKVKGEWRLKF